MLASCTQPKPPPDTYTRKDIPPLAVLVADYVVVDKSARRLRLLSKGRILGEYPIALGFAPVGHKQRAGDGRTPEGRYWIDKRNPDSDYYLSLGISYPNGRDLAAAMAEGVDPGGDIFIHGQPNGSGPDRRIDGDWTFGCIAVTDDAIREIWSRVPTGIPIEIRP